MTFKSLVLGAAGLATAGMLLPTGALAQDGGAEEYVRVCDVYGTGFYYIPGTETCLKISGYVRAEVHYWPGSAAQDYVAPGGVDADGNVLDDGQLRVPATAQGYFNTVRFSPMFTAMSETEYGTLTTYAQVFFDWTGIFSRAGAGGSTYGYGTAFTLDHAYIELAGIRIGKSDSPYSRFLGYGPNILWYDGIYGFNGNALELSYTYTNDSGLSAIVAAVSDNVDSDWIPNFEGGVSLTKDWGSVGVIFGYDEGSQNWGGKLVARFAPEGSRFNANVHVFYSSPTAVAGIYTITDDYGGAPTRWSIMGSVGVKLTDMISINTAAQWYDTNNWYLAANMPVAVATNLSITPEVAYFTASRSFYGMLRVEAGF